MLPGAEQSSACPPQSSICVRTVLPTDWLGHQCGVCCSHIEHARSSCMQAPGDPERDELQQSLLSTLQQALAAVPDAVQQQPVWDQAFQAAEDLQLPALLDRLLPLLRAAALSSNVTAQVIAHSAMHA